MVCNKNKMIGLLLLTGVLLVAPFYTHLNIGGLGLILPFNIASWTMATLFIAFMIAVTVRKKKVLYSPLFTYFLLFPFTIILAGLFSTDISQPVVWLFRQLYIIGGLLFLLSLFQLKLKMIQIERLLYWFVIATFLHALVGIAQINEITALLGWIPLSKARLPVGIFQQVNLQAIYLVTGVAIILFLISRPSFSSARLVTKVFFVITLGLAVYVIQTSGSRAGTLTLVMASSLMLFSRRRQLFRHKYTLAGLFIVTIIAVIAGQSGFTRTVDKTKKMTEGELSSARQTMYAIGVELIKNKPLLGYGIGSFPRVYAEQTAKFAAEHSDANISEQTTSHPHNEVLLWMIEGGLLSVIGLLFIFIGLYIALYRSGFSRGGAYVALLLPISFHTQVELPFYGSSAHWFLWLFIIYIIFRHQLNTIQLTLSQAATYTIQGTAVFIALVVLLFMNHTGKAQKEIYDYKFNGGGDLQIPLDNLYFNSIAERIVMQNMLYSSMKQEDLTKIPIFIQWAEFRVAANPELGMFLMLSDAYGVVQDDMNQCRIVNRGLAIYAKNIQLQKIVDQCQ